MKPDKTGIWEWFDRNGTRRLVAVWDVLAKLNSEKPYLRVSWGGGYYNVNDECVGTWEEKYAKAEWTDGTWGKCVGQYEDFNESEIYSTFDENE